MWSWGLPVIGLTLKVAPCRFSSRPGKKLSAAPQRQPRISPITNPISAVLRIDETWVGSRSDARRRDFSGRTHNAQGNCSVRNDDAACKLWGAHAPRVHRSAPRRTDESSVAVSWSSYAREWMFAAPRRKQHARARALPGFNSAGFSEVRAPITLPGTSFFTTKKRSLPRGILRGFTVAL